MKDDEKKFLVLVYYHTVKYGRSPRDVINNGICNIHYKRCWYLLEKWCGKGWYDYGVTLDMGWLTEDGKEAGKNLLDQHNKNAIAP